MADILVLGATGFTGRLIVEYLAQHTERSKFTFAIAARSASKLEALRKDLNLDANIKSFIVDVSKPDEIEAVVTQVKVVLNTVGPFYLWGTPVVAACVRHGKHYVDLNGETHWTEEIINKFDYSASKTGSIIVPSSGFDSVPSDLVVYVANQTIKTLAGPEAGIEHSITGVTVQGGFSGGTLHTILTAIEEGKATATTEQSLSLIPGTPNPMKFLYTLPHTTPAISGGVWVMGATNHAVVQRTWSFHEPQTASITSTSQEDRRRLSYGPNFKYEEFMMMPSTFAAVIANVLLGFTMVLAAISPTRWLLKRVIPAPGEGPSEKDRKNGFLKMINITTSDTTPPIYVQTTIDGKGDPGYSLTAVMISECALSLALDHAKLTALAHQGGVLTPMSAFGEVIIDRLKGTGRLDIHCQPVDEESRKAR